MIVHLKKDSQQAKKEKRFVLTLGCPDQVGIVHAVSGFLLAHNCNIKESAQFETSTSKRFFMRVEFFVPVAGASLEGLQDGFKTLAAKWDMVWQLNDMNCKAKALILVSKFDHCLNDLLYRTRIGELPIDIVAIVSNHEQGAELSERYGIEYHHMPISKATKPVQEKALLALIHKTKPDFIVLARYMQIFSDELCSALPCPTINIHHSFLPGFKGARPYHQAFDRGVKLIGATAHYVTPDLDEGPIIEQDVARVTHGQGPYELAAMGRDIEKRVLSRAVRLQAEHRIFMNADKTVIFS